MKKILIKRATIVNEGAQFKGSIVVKGDKIEEIIREAYDLEEADYDEVVDAEGCYLLPGVIDEHVHFRDPGLTHKADIESESRAAAAGGVTSIMDMPNTIPQTTTIEAWQEKMQLMSDKSHVNYSCYFGATNDNYPLFSQLDLEKVCGIKLFMGASTGNMLVDQQESLKAIFKKSPLLIATHCEDQSIISSNTQHYKQQLNGDVPISYHPMIRSEEACYKSSKLAVQLAKENGARLHLLHLTTEKELELLNTDAPLEERKITGEVCVPHLLFNERDYEKLQGLIKCNPAIKRASDQQALIAAVKAGKLSTIATDHAPHELKDKEGDALTATSGMPMIQFSLLSMLELVQQKVLPLETIVERMCHAPATIYKIRKRGYIRKGYQADLVIVKPNSPWQLSSSEIESKCQWSPLTGRGFTHKIAYTFINGEVVYSAAGINSEVKGEALLFDH